MVIRSQLVLRAPRPASLPAVGISGGNESTYALGIERGHIPAIMLVSCMFVELVILAIVHIYRRCCGADAKRGLDQNDAFHSIPAFVYSSSSVDDMEGGRPECSVCLDEFKDGDRAKRLPHCGHIFHADCLDLWLRNNSTCPLCRSDVRHVPAPSPA